MEFNATFLVSAISFVVFVFLMNLIFYKPVTAVIEEREKMINETLENSKNIRTKASELLAEREKALKKTTDECKKLVSESIENASLKAKQMTADAKTTSAAKIAEGKQKLIFDSNAVKVELDDTTRYLAEEISSKILGYKTKISG